MSRTDTVQGQYGGMNALPRDAYGSNNDGSDIELPSGPGQEPLDVNELMDFFYKVQTDNSQRNGEYEQNRQYVDGNMYDGAHPRPTGTRVALTANYLLPFTMKHVQLLVGRLPAIQVLPAGSEEHHRRHAEALEGICYSAWRHSQAQDLLQKVAWDSFVLRRGLVYYWWEPGQSGTPGQFRFKYVTPDDFYPEWDGDRMYRAMYAYRRHVDSMRREYPDKANVIAADPMTTPGPQAIYGMDQPRLDQTHYVTVYDYFDKWGRYARVANEQLLVQGNLGHPEPEVPFIEFPYYPANGNREPENGLDPLVQLNQHLNALISQKSDIIRKYANPTVLNKQSGNSAEEVRRATSAEGSVLNVHKDGEVSYLNWDGTVPAIDEQIQLVLDTMFDISGKPRSAFGQTITNQSGVMTNLSLTPTLQSNEYHETLWGRRLSHLNARCLALTEHFNKGTEITYRGRVPVGRDLAKTRMVETTIDPKEIGGWYENVIKWPSAIRVDDPVHIQSVIQRLTSDPPAISLYSALEELGVEDVEEEIDRILEQREDPRLSADTVAAGAASAMGIGDPALAGAIAGAPPPESGGVPPQTGVPAMTGQAAMSAGNPNAEILS